MSKQAETWDGYVATVARACTDLCVTDGEGRAVKVSDAFDRWREWTDALQRRDGALFFVGNGGSAAIASHMAVDAAKNGGLRAMAFNDSALLTATANDVSFDAVFALPLGRLARPGDMLIAISSSGNSPNIVAALQAARAQELTIVTLSGKNADNQSRSLGHLNFYIPVSRYGWVESSHQVVLHYWLDLYLDAHGGGAI
jgi:D-sedoheptulose 7-phosphate isomerase